MSAARNGRAVAVAGVAKRYGDVVALDGIDVEVDRGEIFGLIGPNGAGKTTLIRILVGTLRPDTGTVEVLGLRPVADRRELRRRIGYMPQEPALYEDLTVRDNVSFFGAAHLSDGLGAHTAEAIDFVDLADRADDPVFALSGGMKQRVSLACALVHRPDLLFLDEPTAGIDPELREVFWRGFRRLAADGVTLVVSTHQMVEALKCDRVAILRRGDVIAAAEPGDLLDQGRTTVRLWRNGAVEEVAVDDYRVELPALLCGRGDVERVEVRQEDLEQIVLRLIADEGRVRHAPDA